MRDLTRDLMRDLISISCQQGSHTHTTHTHHTHTTHTYLPVHGVQDDGSGFVQVLRNENLPGGPVQPGDLRQGNT